MHYIINYNCVVMQYILLKICETLIENMYE